MEGIAHSGPCAPFYYSRIRNKPNAGLLALGGCARVLDIQWMSSNNRSGASTKYPTPWGGLAKEKLSHAP